MPPAPQGHDLCTGDLIRGAGALVRLNSIEEAAHAIEALNNRPPVPGSALPLLVRFADSPEEKARKLAKRTAHSNRGSTRMTPLCPLPQPPVGTARFCLSPASRLHSLQCLRVARQCWREAQSAYAQSAGCQLVCK